MADDHKKVRSPYQRYQKTPYRYEFPSCSHKNAVAQSTPTWAGWACNSCNIIVDGPRRRFLAEAA